MFAAKITDIFFDLDHTLWDFDTNSALAFETIFEEKFPEINLDAFSSNYTKINQECWKLFQNDLITHQELRYNRLRFTFDAIGFEISDAEIDLISKEYIVYLPQNNHLFDGAIEILEYLKSKYKLHIITNGLAEVQFRKLKNSNLDAFFDTVTHSEIAGVKKPNSAIFEYALNLAKAKKENSIMIGDCLEADVQGALNIGLEAIFFNEKKLPVPENIKQITHLLQLKNFL